MLRPTLGAYTAGLALLLMGLFISYQRFQAPVAPEPEAPAQVAEEQPAAPETAAGQPSDADLATQEAAAADPALAAPERLSLPLAGAPTLLKPFGSLDETYGDYRLYTGADLKANPGEPVLAAAEGKVIAIEEDPVQGLTLVLEHGGGLTTRYGALTRTLVAEGDQVEAGAQIGQASSYLIFSVWDEGQPVDPLSLLVE